MRFITLITSIFIGLSACTPLPGLTKQQPRPKNLTSPGPSVESQKVANYYASVQARLRARGRLRQELSPSDARFTTQDLITNFERVALFDEYSERGGKFIERQTPSSLRRWERPVRIALHFGPSTSKEQRAADTAYVRNFATRLARLSGLDIQLTDAKRANFSLLFLNKDEQRDYISELVGQVKYLIPKISNEIKNSPRGIFCVAYAVSDSNSLAGYKGVIILIKGEHRGLMRESCIHEEMTQALGLANDSPDARPSIFNDDEEFALLTRHDELLLKMLYDPRLKIGMTIKEAHPIVQQIAQELMALGRS
ncbi:MAG: DUF2927 domain-containing protein [Amylibacter sp.]|nr:DUF2927 domain-containing protein [Amylibacter sp.]